MKKQKYPVSALCGMLIAGGLAGCSMAATQGGASTINAGLTQESNVSATNFSVAIHDDGTEDADVS